jgi:hypothetical protein
MILFNINGVYIALGQEMQKAKDRPCDVPGKNDG